MSIHALSLAVFLVLCLLCVIHVVYYYPKLPNRIASHFSIAGKPDAWSSKKTFTIAYLIGVGICAALFLGIGYRMPKTSSMNMPNKDYWLAPEQRQATFDFISCYILWMGSATAALLLDVSHQTTRVNLGKAERMEHPWWSIGIYTIFTIAWCIGLHMKFGMK